MVLIPYPDSGTRSRGGNPMPRLPLVRHLTERQILRKYRACRHPIEKTRWHAVWLLARTDEPRTPARVADLVGLSAVTVRDVLHRWNDRGPDGLTDRRKDNGADPKLSDRQREALFTALSGRLPGGSSLARLLLKHRGRRHKKYLPKLTTGLVLSWADAHFRRNGRWASPAGTGCSPPTNTGAGSCSQPYPGCHRPTE